MTPVHISLREHIYSMHSISVPYWHHWLLSINSHFVVDRELYLRNNNYKIRIIIIVISVKLSIMIFFFRRASRSVETGLKTWHKRPEIFNWRCGTAGLETEETWQQRTRVLQQNPIMWARTLLSVLIKFSTSLIVCFILLFMFLF